LHDFDPALLSLLFGDLKESFLFYYLSKW